MTARSPLLAAALVAFAATAQSSPLTWSLSGTWSDTADALTGTVTVDTDSALLTWNVTSNLPGASTAIYDPLAGDPVAGGGTYGGFQLSFFDGPVPGLRGYRAITFDTDSFFALLDPSPGYVGFTMDEREGDTFYGTNRGEHTGTGVASFVQPVPEPSSLAVALLGLAGLALIRRRKLGRTSSPHALA
jgi:MYXO-CTERM domain-containing protein